MAALPAMANSGNFSVNGVPVPAMVALGADGAPLQQPNGTPGATPGSPSYVQVVSGGAASSATYTATAVAYAAGNTMGSVQEFTVLGAPGSCIRITGVELEVDAASVQSGETSYRLYLYSVTPPTALANNTVWDLPSGDRASFLGYVDLGSPVDLGSTLYVQTADVDKDLKLSGTSVFGYLVTNGAFTATVAARKVTLHAISL